MAGIRLLPEEPETTPQQQARAAAAVTTTTTDSLASDDDRSIAADSWSIKSEYGSTLDDDQRHADAAEALSSANFRVSSDYRFRISATMGENCIELWIRLRNWGS
jgi:hypothetical protein